MKKAVLSLSVVAMLLSDCTRHNTINTESVSETHPLPEIAMATQLEPLVPPKTTHITWPDIYQDINQQPTQVIRQGRYTLVNTSPEDGQKYLLEQMVSINIQPKKKQAMTATVEQGLRTTLSGTGLNLCYSSAFNQVSDLFSLPLPKIHHQFGPIKLREALQMLAGPAYRVTLDDITRTVCFETRDKPVDKAIKRVEVISTTTTTEVINE